MKLLTVVGARPQFVKAAVVSHAIQDIGGVEEIILHTGQHYDHSMSESFFHDLRIPRPKYNLKIGSGTHGAQTGRMIEAIENVIFDERPDLVNVYGDTNSTLAGALVAAKLNISISHVEAGLRSFNKKMPEEINRILTDQISEILFAPTQTSVENLIREGIEPSKISMVGDVMYDAALAFFDKNRSKKLLDDYRLDESEYVLATIHRAENTDDPLRLTQILNNLMLISKKNKVLFPIHPRTTAALKSIGLYDDACEKLQCISPLSYLDMLAMERTAKLIITDSGGVQKEAFFSRVPCLIVRNETEWVELVVAGAARLVKPENIYYEYDQMSFLNSMHFDSTLYGGGSASKQIANIFSKFGGY